MKQRWTVATIAILMAGCGAADNATDPSPVPVTMDEPTDEPDPAPAVAVEQDPVGPPIADDAAPHSSHHQLRLKGNRYVGASVDVKIDEVPRHGLRFFALQVNFADVAWAHGGLQKDPDEGQANWGGLVPGVSYDYEGHELDTLQNIQNMPGRTREASWREDTWYRYEITRGPLEVLPAGEYSVLTEEPTMVPNDREMWRWDFTIREIETDVVVWEQSLYVAHAVITSATYWTETGYGMTCDDRITVQWRNPYFTDEDGEQWLPHSIKKSIDNSTCPDDRTTDMATAQNGGEYGTVQYYGVERAPGSRDGDLLYIDSPYL